MLTMTSLTTQTTMSYSDYVQRMGTIPFEAFKLISEKFPLRGEEAVKVWRSAFASMSNRAEEEGLTEDDVMQMLNEK